MPAELPPQTGIISSAPEAPVPYLEAWHEVLHLGEALDDARLIAEFGCLSGLTADRIPVEQTAAVEAYADVRLMGSANAMRIRVLEPTLEHIHARFRHAHLEQHETVAMEPIEIVTIRLRRFRNPHD